MKEGLPFFLTSGGNTVKISKKSVMPRSAIPPSAGKRGLIYEPRLMQCYLMPDETALRELSEGVIEKLKLLTDAEFAELEFPPD